MDAFEAALQEIQKQYPLRRMGKHYAQIELDILFDPYNYIFIGVLFENDQVLLTDMADYAPLCDWEDENVPEVEAICASFGIAFHNYHIECVYHSNGDVKRYLDCLLSLRERYIGDID